MIQTTITYLNVSPLTAREGQRGQEIKLAFRAAVDSTLAASDIARFFSFFAEIIIRLEWKKRDGAGGEYIVAERQRIFRPMRHYILQENMSYAANCFLESDFLKVQPGYPEAAVISARVSLLPVLAFAKKNIPYDSDNRRYTLHTANEGDLSEYMNAAQGFEY